MAPPARTEPTIKLSLGWPAGLAAELALDRPSVTRFLRRFWFAPLAERLFLVRAQVEIIVPEDDSGRLQCILGLANFCFRQVKVASLHVDYLTIANGSLADFNPHLEAPEFIIPPRGVGEVLFSHRLGPGEVRDLQRFIGKSNYPKSTPIARTGLTGSLGIRHWSGSYHVTFSIDGITPLLIMYNPSNLSCA